MSEGPLYVVSRCEGGASGKRLLGQKGGGKSRANLSASAQCLGNFTQEFSGPGQTLVKLLLPTFLTAKDVPCMGGSWLRSTPVCCDGTTPRALDGGVSAFHSTGSLFLLALGIVCLAPRGLCRRLFSSFRGMIGMIGTAGRSRVLLRLLWLLVRDEVSESSRGPGAMVSQRQRVKQDWSLAFLGRTFLVQCPVSSFECSMYSVQRAMFRKERFIDDEDSSGKVVNKVPGRRT